jgi:hypothetical protein
LIVDALAEADKIKTFPNLSMPDPILRKKFQAMFIAEKEKINKAKLF